MSDAKAADSKPEAKAPAETKPAESVKPAPAPAPEAAKPAEVKPAAAEAKPAVPAKAPEAAKPAEVKPAAAAPVAKAPEAKPAAAAVPAAAAAKAPEAKPAAPEGPKPGTVGVRAPAPKAPEASVNIMITAKAAIYIMSGLVTLVLVLGATTVFLLVRMTDRSPLARVTWQGPGQEGPGFAASHPGTGAGTPNKAPGASHDAPTAEKDSDPTKSDVIEAVEIGVNFKDKLGGTPGGPTGSWPWFRGTNYDNTVTGVPLANKWPASGPPIKWKMDLGEGYSGPAVLGGRMYLQDYDGKTNEEALRCFSMEDGKEIWRRSHPVKIVNNHGWTRTVPAVTEKYAVMMGSFCHVMCVDAQTGAMKWGIDLRKDYGTVNPNWYTAQCPVIDGNTALVAPGGTDVLMMGIDLETGKVLWKTPNPNKVTMSHSSISILTLAGKRTYVYCGEWGKMTGVSAEPADLGAPLWYIQCLMQQTMSPAPVAVDDSKVFMTSGVRAGSALVQISKAGDKFEAKLVYNLDYSDGFSTEQQTPIFFNKHLFGLMPESSGGHKKQLACMNPFDKGKIVWESGKTKRFGQWEAVLLGDGKFFVLDENCRLYLVKASIEKYEELGQCKVLQGREAWAPMVLVGDRLLLRDSKMMVCLDVGKSIE
jgi:outer membrane protein assembly factor BamB